MESAAWKVSVRVDPETKESLKRLEQTEVPSELMQSARMSARVMSLAVSVVLLAESCGEGATPRVESARSMAVCMAFWRPGVLVAEAPTLATEEAKGARAQAAATVVSSLMEMLGIVASELQSPRSATRAIALLLAVPLRPGLPPVAAM